MSSSNQDHVLKTAQRLIRQSRSDLPIYISCLIYHYLLRSVGSTFWPFAAALWFVFTFGVVSDNAIVEIVQLHDKLVHFFAFCIESWLFCRLIATRIISFPFTLGRFGRFFNSSDEENNYDDDRYLKTSKFTLALVVCIGTGILSEFLQRGLSGGKRTFDPMDMLYNVLGCLLGITVAYRCE